MNADSYFAIGKSHTVCQDYARAGNCFAIVSDGCSSSPDSDFGARALTMAAIEVLESFGDQFPNQGDRMMRQAVLYVPHSLPVECLDATLLAAYPQEDGRIQVIVCGDGIVFGIKHDGDIVSYEISMGGMPNYLSYLLDQERSRRYAASGPDKFTVQKRVVGADDTVKSDQTDEWHFRSGCPDVACRFNPAEYKFVGVATDGLLSFQHRETLAPIPLGEVLKHVTDIRVPTGAFVQRSSKFFLQKTCPKLGWQHSDDYGVAMIYTGESK